MKKSTIIFAVVLCMLFCLFPAARVSAAENDSADRTILAVKNVLRTDSGLSFQTDFSSLPSDAFLYVAVYDTANGKLKSSFPVESLQASAPIRVSGVADGDLVKVILTDRALKPYDYREIRRPAEQQTSVEENSGFNTELLNLLRPNYLSASEELALAETEKQAETDPYAFKRLIGKTDQKLPELSAYGVMNQLTDASGHFFLWLNSEENAKACEAYLRSLPYIQYVEPDILQKSVLEDSTATLSDSSGDYLSWGVTAIKADVLSEHLRNTEERTVVVAVVDSGVEQTHPFLTDRVLEGFDFYDNDEDPKDEHSHGTHVSGTIVDCTPGLDIRILPVRVLGPTGGGSTTTVKLGIDYAVEQGADIINMSLGGGHSNFLDEAIYDAISKGVTVVVAAGNEGNDVMDHCPAHVYEAITVGAVDADLDKAYFSNSGDALDVVAPGVEIYSSVLNGQYEVKSGTSMATPHVAAAAALLKYGFPDKTPEEIQDALKLTAADLGSEGWDADYGYGFINLAPFIDGWPEGEVPSPSPGPDPDPNPDTPHVYELFETGMVWADAKAYCEQLGGHLMTVSSQEEQDILASLLEEEGARNGYWLGGYLNDSDEYVWVTGEAFTYTNWAPEQPDHHHGTEDCLMVYRNENYGSTLGQWNDLDSDGTCQEQVFFGLDNIGFICEWDEGRPDPDPDPDPEPESGIFALLYETGELVFQNDNLPRQSGKPVAVYPVDGAILQENTGVVQITHADGSVSEEVGVDYADWYQQRESITSVTILDKIQPTSTALWFHGCVNLESVSGLEYLDTGAVHNMSHMFSDCRQLAELDVSWFNTAAVNNMSHMFFGCENLLNLDLRSFDTAAVTDMGSMFTDCAALERIYADDSFVVAQVTNSTNMFKGCAALEGTYGTRYDAGHIDKEYARLDDPADPPVAPGYFTDIDVVPAKANVYLYDDGELVFQLRRGADPGRTLVTSYEIDVVKRDIASEYALWYDRRAEIKTVTFADVIRPFATSQWFYGCENLTEIRNLENLDTRFVKDMSYMFADTGLSSLNLSGLNTAKVTTMKSMFQDSASLVELNLSGISSEHVSNMSSMFDGCEGLTELILTDFCTSAVTDMSNMFRDCAALTSMDLSGFDTANVTNMSGMFRGTGLETLSLTAEENSGWITDQVTNMDNMFRDCSALTTIYVQSGTFGTEAVSTSANMFTGAGQLLGGRGTAYDEAHTDKAYAHIDYGERNPGYFTDPYLMMLRFDANDSTEAPASGSMEDLLFSKGETVQLPPNAFTREGYEFLGWNTTADGSGAGYADETSITLTEDLTLYAQWARKPVLHFEANDSTEDPAEGTMADQVFTSGVADQIAPNAFTREGYDFLGWNTAADGSGAGYADEASITLTEDLTLYAQWDYHYMEQLYAILYDDGELVFQWNDVADPNRGTVRTYVTDRSGYSDNRANEDNYRAWHNEAAQIQTVSFAKRIQPDDVAQWFQDCVNLIALYNLDNLDTSLVTDMSMMFAGCDSLEILDLHTFDTALVTNYANMFEGCAHLESVDLCSFKTAAGQNMANMFSGCEALTTIYASNDYVTANASGKNMFRDCEKLVGGNGTVFDSAHTDTEYARVDNGTSQPGYFTFKEIGTVAS